MGSIVPGCVLNWCRDMLNCSEHKQMTEIEPTPFFLNVYLWFSCTHVNTLIAPSHPSLKNPQVLRYSVKHLNGRTNHRSLPVFFIFLFTYKPPKLSGTRDTKPDSCEALAPSAKNMISAGWSERRGDCIDRQSKMLSPQLYGFCFL